MTVKQNPSPVRRILVVDDNDDAAKSLAILLEFSDYEVRIANDGPAALALAAQFLPDIIVLDIGLPGMSGYEVAQRLRESQCAARIIALSGYGPAKDVDAAKLAAFDRRLIKPIEIDVLQQAIEDLQ